MKIRKGAALLTVVFGITSAGVIFAGDPHKRPDVIPPTNMQPEFKAVDIIAPPAALQIIELENGMTLHIQKFDDGSILRTLIDANGETVKTVQIMPDGSKTIINFQDGEAVSKILVSTNDNGETVREVYRKDEEGEWSKVKTVIIREDGTKTITRYDSDGNVVSRVEVSTDEDGNTRRDIYDGDGNLERSIIISEADEDGVEIRLVYDSEGTLIRTVHVTKNEDGSMTRQVYNPDGKLILEGTIDASGEGVYTVYDPDTGEEKGTIEVTVNDDGTRTRTHKNLDGEVTKIVTVSRDGGRRVENRDPDTDDIINYAVTSTNNGVTTTKVYDADDNLIREVVVDADGTKHIYQIDPDSGDITSFIRIDFRGDGVEFRTHYDSSGAVLREIAINPDGSREITVYNETAQVVKKIREIMKDGKKVREVYLPSATGEMKLVMTVTTWADSNGNMKKVVETYPQNNKIVRTFYVNNKVEKKVSREVDDEGNVTKQTVQIYGDDGQVKRTVTIEKQDNGKWLVSVNGQTSRVIEDRAAVRRINNNWKEE